MSICRDRVFVKVGGGMLVLAALLVGSGCDVFEPVAFEPEFVVEAYLAAGEEMPSIRVSRTGPLDEAYNFEERAVSDARVTVALLDERGAIEREYRYSESMFREGIYLPQSPDTVTGGRTYVLTVEPADGGAPIRARTTVPEALFITNISASRLVYQGEEQFEVDVSTTAEEIGDRIFMFTARALEPTEANLTPFARSIYEQGDLELQDLITSSSPLLNEANYDAVAGQTIRIALPWIAVSFYGANELSLASVDTNYYDFYRTLNVQQGGSTLSPGEIPEVLDHVEGGRGIFGSFARVSAVLMVMREGEQVREAASL